MLMQVAADVRREAHRQDNAVPRTFKSSALEGVKIVTACDVQQGKVEFLVPDYIIRASLNNLTGDGGSGKGYQVADHAARISRGEPFFDGDAPNPLGGPADVAICEMEDSAGSLRARLEKQGADLTRVHFLRGAFALTRDTLKALGEGLFTEFPALALLVFSPFNSYMPRGTDWASDVSLHQVLDPLTAFADDHGITIITITHTGKFSELRKAQHATLGSVAYANGPRMTLATIATPSIVKPGNPRPPTHGRVGVTKYNDGPFSPTLAFLIDDEGLHWQGATEEDMRVLIEQPKPSVEANKTSRPKREAAREFLRSRLYPDKRGLRKDLVAEVEKAGLCSPRTLDLAHDDLPIETEGEHWVGRWPVAA